MDRRSFIKTSAAVSLAALPVNNTTATQKPAEEPVPLRIGYLPITDATPLLIAHANGYFLEEGLQAEQPALIRSWSALVESFLTGKFNVVHLLLPIPIWMRYKNRYNVKIVAWDHLNGSALTVGRDTGIENFSHLGGKRIAVPYWYSMHNVILQMGLRKAGITPVIKPQATQIQKNEANLFLLPPPEMPNALASRKIDGYIVAEPFNALGELKIKAKIMRFTGDMWKNHPCCVVVMKDELIRSRPVFTQKVINSIVRAQKWILGHMKETADILSKEGNGYLPMRRKTLERVFTVYDIATYGNKNENKNSNRVSPNNGMQPNGAIRNPNWGVHRIGFQPYPYPSATEFIFNQLRHTVVQGESGFLETVKPIDAVKNLVAYDFVKNAINENGGPGIFPDMNLKSPWDREEIIDI